MSQIIYREESFKIVGACFEVYNQKGFGFTEAIYHECLAHEFVIQDIPFVSQPELPLAYKGRPLIQKFRPDLICYEKIIVEPKTVAGISDAHRTQVLNYLRATSFDLGLLINFGQFPKLVYERLVGNRRNSSAGKYEVLAGRLSP